MSESLFQTLSNLRQKTRTISITLGNANPAAPGEVEAISADSVEFEIHMLTPEESNAADSIMHEVLPPAMKESAPGPNGVGMTERITGYDYDDPGYRNRRVAQMRIRDSFTALLGCDRLRESTPGERLDEKADNLRNALPHSVIATIAQEVANFTVAYDRVEDFFSSGGSTDSPASGPSTAEEAPDAKTGSATKSKPSPSAPSE